MFFQHPIVQCPRARVQKLIQLLNMICTKPGAYTGFVLNYHCSLGTFLSNDNRSIGKKLTHCIIHKLIAVPIHYMVQGVPENMRHSDILTSYMFSYK